MNPRAATDQELRAAAADGDAEAQLELIRRLRNAARVLRRSAAEISDEASRLEGEWGLKTTERARS